MGGPALTIIIFLMAALACLPLVSAPSEVGAERSGTRGVNEVRQLATALQVQQQALQAYHVANPGATGNVTAALVIPAPWAAVPGLVSVLGTSGAYTIGVTYYNSIRYTAGNVTAALVDDTEYSGNVGITSAGGMISAQGTVVPLPNGVPAGYAGIAAVLD